MNAQIKSSTDISQPSNDIVDDMVWLLLLLQYYSTTTTVPLTTTTVLLTTLLYIFLLSVIFFDIGVFSIYLLSIIYIVKRLDRFILKNHNDNTLKIAILLC